MLPNIENLVLLESDIAYVLPIPRSPSTIDTWSLQPVSTSICDSLIGSVQYIGQLEPLGLAYLILSSFLFSLSMDPL